MSDATIHRPNDLDFLAAEYALGVLDKTDRRRAAVLIEHNAGFARQVDAWNERLAPLGEAIAAEPVPWTVWHRIQLTLAAEDNSQTTRPATSVAGPNLWRWLTFAASTIAASLAGFIILAPTAAQQEGRYVAILTRDATEPGWLVILDIAGKTLAIDPLIDMSPDNKAMELWLIAGSDTPPRSLGLIDPGNPRTLTLPVGRQSPGLGGALLAVSLEPRSGSPTGIPTGPVIFQGNVLPLK